MALGGIVVVGGLLRAVGLTSRDPWFDDAWVLLAGRHGLHALVKMAGTAPGYDLGLSLLWRASPGSTWLVQLPELVFGTLGIVAVFALVRWFGCRRPLPLVAAALVAASPVAVAYSTRLKPYAFDFLVACLLLFLAERWRRAPSGRRLAHLGLASLLAFVSSASLPVLAGATALVVATAVGLPALRRQAAVACCWFAAILGGLWIVSLQLLPASLTSFWRNQGDMLVTSSPRQATFSFQQMGAGFLDGLLHLPAQVSVTEGLAVRDGHRVPVLVEQLWPIELAIAACAFVAVAVLCAVPLVATVRTRCRQVHPGLVAAIALLAGLTAALAGLSPFGGGRTDEVLYPAVLLLAALLAESLADRVVRVVPRWCRFTAAALACAGLLAATSVHLPRYPTSDVRGVAVVVLGHLEPDEVVVVDGDATYTWAAERLTRSDVSFRWGVLWSEGFHAVSRDRRVVLAGRFVEPDVPLGRLTARADRVWFVSETLGAILGTGETGQSLAEPVSSPTLGELHALGFTRVERRVDRLHTYALLLGRVR